MGNSDTQVPKLPKKLKRDAIIEALVEVRFESSLLVELFFGRLADHSAWRSFQTTRLPAAEMPVILRRMNPDFRFAPTYELKGRNEHENRSIKVGPSVISFHNKAPYLGWSQFWPENEEMLDFLFTHGVNLQILRMGLRYINAFTERDHGICALSDLNLSISIAKTNITEKFQFFYTSQAQEDVECAVRVSAPAFVQGLLPPATTALVDIDVYSGERVRIRDANAAKDWLLRAHEAEKEAFFNLLTPETIAELREDV